ncbi:MAG: hypothetical protein LAT51_13035, partial [Flavobacteriaceae bacterium]|nr:hypothetical protein [Flavobacteriaceae bacterium]
MSTVNSEILKIAILKNETNDEHYSWLHALNKVDGIEICVIDLSLAGWIESTLSNYIDLCLARPSGAVGYYKEMYDERLHTINRELKLPVYPTLEECRIYENKRSLAYMLQALVIKHPVTQIFYNFEEALLFIESTTYPFVAKTAIGAGGSGVKIIRSANEARSYIKQAFTTGITRSWGPNLRKGHFKERLINRISNIPETIRWFKKKKERATIDPQKGYVLFQQYIPCDHEWRCVVVGDSYFGH